MRFIQIFRALKMIYGEYRFKADLMLADQYGVAAVYAKRYSIKFGSNVRITGNIDWGSEPYLITIGNNVTITQDVRFHTHDGGVGIFRAEHPGLNIFGKISIGNNVFIGSGVQIMPNVEIGSNVIIGAGSIVTKNVSSNVVVAGVPARVIKPIDVYKEDCLRKATYIKNTDPVLRKEEVLNSFEKLSGD